MSNTITVTFTDPTYADRALENLIALHEARRLSLRGAIVAIKDGDGVITIHKERRFTAVRDNPSQQEGISGPIANTMVSSHLGGNLMGGQAGALAGMSPQLRINSDQVEAVADRLPPGSSVLLFEYSDGRSAFIAAIIRDLNGHPYAVDVTDETKSDLEAALRGRG